MADNFESVRKAMGFNAEAPKAIETSFDTKSSAPDNGVIFKQGGSLVQSAAMPTKMAMKIGISDNKLTIEMERETAWMQFDKATAFNLIKTLTQYARTIR